MQRKHAIVMGASMAGLMAARALTDHFESVTLIERDPLPEGPENRRGVPQGKHTHGLLAGGRETLERQFPGIAAQMLAAGAVPCDLVRDCRWFFEGAPLARPASDLDGVLATRPFIESFVRRRVLALSKVTLRDDCRVEGLLFADGRVTGVKLSGDDTLAADLVIDATGRGSHAAQWLGEMGFEKPAEERVEVGIAYTTRLFRRQPHDLDGCCGTVVPPTASGKRGGVLVAQEGDRWTATLFGYFGNVAPEDLGGFVDYAHTLPSPDIYNVIRQAEPLGDAISARFPASLRRRYERLSRFPEGFLVMGDAVCSFNPIYGQGMSVAALESLALDAALKEGDTNLSRRFFARIAKVVDNPWTIAVGNDLRIPETVGPRNAVVNLVNRYLARLHRVGHEDAELSLAFHRVSNLLEGPPSLFRPGVVLRVLRGATSRPERTPAEHSPEALSPNIRK